MKKLSSKARSYLRSKAHHLNAVVQIGQNGVNKGAIFSVNSNLEARELIKIKFREFKGEKASLSSEIAEKTNSEIVGIVGHTLILFRQNTVPEKQIYQIPKK